MTLWLMNYVIGTNVSIGDKWAAEISAEVKKAVASAFDSKYGRRSTMSFTGEFDRMDVKFCGSNFCCSCRKDLCDVKETRI